MTTLRFLDANDVHRFAPWEGLVAAMLDAHRRERPAAAQCRLRQETEGGQPDMLMVVPAWERGRSLGVKIVTSFPRNAERHGLSTVGSTYVMLDAETGKPHTILDGEALIFRKTAADTALGALRLSRPDAARLLVLGAGALAPYLVEALRVVRPGIGKVRIWNRTRRKAEKLAARWDGSALEVSASDDLREAQEWADIVVAATMSTEPLVRGEWLRPGTHVGLVGSFTPEMREGDDGLLRRAAIHVDDLHVLQTSGEFTGPLAAGVIARSDILGDLFDLCRIHEPAGGIGRDVTLFKNGGANHLDLVTASFVVANASREEAGRT